jgi:hypothetical protein
MNSLNRNVIDLESFRASKTIRPTIATQSANFEQIRDSAVRDRSYEPIWESAVSDRLKSLLSLPAGWDNSDSRRVDPWTAEFANTLLHYIWPVDGPTPFVVPTCYGGIQFEWHLPDLEFEIEVVRRHYIEVLVVDSQDASETYFQCKHDLTELFVAAEKFLDRYKSGLHETAAA